MSANNGHRMVVSLIIIINITVIVKEHHESAIRLKKTFTSLCKKKKAEKWVLCRFTVRHRKLNKQLKRGVKPRGSNGIMTLGSKPFYTSAATNALLLHTFNGLFSRTTWVSRYQNSKTSLDLNEARDDGMQWHQMDHIRTICTSLQR